MPWRMLLFILFLSGSSVGQFLPASEAAEKPNPQLEALINSPEYREASWGYLIVDLDTGDTIDECQADKLFAPASTTKLFSCATALDVMGANHRFETPVYRRGEIDSSGHLQGDLILVASGDFTLGGRTTPAGNIAFSSVDHIYASDSSAAELTAPDPLQGLNQLAKQIAASGITQVTGDVVIDDRLFDSNESSGSGPVRVSAMMINDNLVDFVITPTKAGQPVQVTSRPQSAALQIDSRVKTVAAADPVDVSLHFAGPRNIVLEGQIPEGRKPLVRALEVPDSASFARSLFIEALQRAGVSVGKSVLSDNTQDQLASAEEVARLPKVAVFQSPPFHESIKLILKSSHNLHASALPLVVATKHGKRTLEDGMKLEREFLQRAGIQVETISFGGGAGGSPADAVTPRATVALLSYMARHPDAAFYRASLPILGLDGTLASTVGPDSPARGQVFAKTGTLFFKDVLNDKFLVTSKALAGYMTTSKKKNLAFAVFLNKAHIEHDSDTAKVGKSLGRFCELIWEAN
jgi:D-alanyl-D-alanine carboxypeptidase/D-alanyl-D-alanine-endopeptidase (penicillin-binding protein 4)